LSDVNAVFAGRTGWVSRWLAPLGRQFWMIALIVTVGALATLAYSHMQPPQYEASAVVQVQSGIRAGNVAAHLLGRDNLLSIAARHGFNVDSINRDKVAVQLRAAIAINDLTSDAGQSLGYPPQLAGLVVSVLWPDAELSARVANDLAQQILDYGNAGRLDADRDDLDFYRRDEQRLWQELSAFRAEQEEAAGTVGALDTAVVWQRRMMLMQDQYDRLRQKLADAEIGARLGGYLAARQFSLLRRATVIEAVNVVQDWMLGGVAGSLLLAVTLAFVLERRFPALQRGPWAELTLLHTRTSRLYRLFDDPARPILGIPRFVVTAALTVVWLYQIATLFT